MANFFTLDCETAQGLKRVYHSRCPLWCADHLDTDNWSMDFNGFSNVTGADEVLSNSTIADSRGVLWHYAGADLQAADVDADVVGLMAPNGTDEPCPNAFEPDPNSGYLSLVPERNRHPHFNATKPYTIMIEGSVSANSVVAVTRGVHYGDPTDQHSSCIHEVRASLAGKRGAGGGAIVGGFTDFTSSHQSFCASAGPDVDHVGLGLAGADGSCACFFLIVDPCEHTLSKEVRVRHISTINADIWNEPGEVQVHYLDGIPATPRFPQDRRIRFDLTCDNWWKPQGTYGINVDRGIPGAGSLGSQGLIPPPRLIGSYSRNSTWAINLGGEGPNAVNAIRVKRIQVWDRALRSSDISLLCPLAGPPTP